MTAADRALLAILLAAAIGVFVLASGSRTAPMRIMGFFIAAALAWGGIAYMWAIITVQSG